MHTATTKLKKCAYQFLFSQKGLAGAMALIFLASTVSAPVAEANFWKERRAAVAQTRPDSASSTQMAALPAPQNALFPWNQKVLNGLPANTASGFSFSAKGLPDGLRQLLTPYADIRSFHLASGFAGRDSWSFSNDKSSPLIVLIQDAHDVPEAQRNIALLLNGYQSDLGLRLVGLEGARGSFQLAPYRALSNQETMRQISDYLLESRLITGAEYFGLTAPKQPALWGVEDEPLYLSNVEAFRNTLPYQKSVETYESNLAAALAQLKTKIYDADLKNADNAISQYSDGRMSLPDYIHSLSKYLARAENTGQFPNVAIFEKALELESTLNFEKVEAERTELLKQLTQKLTPAELSGLMDASLRYRQQKIGFGDYHASLRALAAKHGVAFASFPQLNQYVDYAMVVDRIDREKFLNELSGFEQAANDSLAKTAGQRDLLHLTRDAGALHKLFSHNFTTNDWKTYLPNKDRFAHFTDRLASLGRAAGVSVQQLTQLPAPLSVYEDFYRRASDRNDTFVRNISAQMKSTGERSAVIVAGGFHTDGLCSILEKQNLSYVVLTPRITKVDLKDRYLDVFARGRTPLEKLMLGEKLFLEKPLPIAQVSFAGFEDAHMAVLRMVVSLYIGSMARLGRLQLALDEIHNNLPAVAVAASIVSAKFFTVSVQFLSNTHATVVVVMGAALAVAAVGGAITGRLSDKLSFAISAEEPSVASRFKETRVARSIGSGFVWTRNHTRQVAAGILSITSIVLGIANFNQPGQLIAGVIAAGAVLNDEVLPGLWQSVQHALDGEKALLYSFIAHRYFNGHSFGEALPTMQEAINSASTPHARQTYIAELETMGDQLVSSASGNTGDARKYYEYATSFYQAVLAASEPLTQPLEDVRHAAAQLSPAVALASPDTEAAVQALERSDEFTELLMSLSASHSVPGQTAPIYNRIAQLYLNAGAFDRAVLNLEQAIISEQNLDTRAAYFSELEQAGHALVKQAAESVRSGNVAAAKWYYATAINTYEVVKAHRLQTPAFVAISRKLADARRALEQLRSAETSSTFSATQKPFGAHLDSEWLERQVAELGGLDSSAFRQVQSSRLEEFANKLYRMYRNENSHSWKNQQFQRAFPNFFWEIRFVANLIDGGSARDLARESAKLRGPIFYYPPFTHVRFYEANEPLIDPETGLDVEAGSYVDGDTLIVVLSQDNLLGAFHEIYETVFLNANPSIPRDARHTLAALAERGLFANRSLESLYREYVNDQSVPTLRAVRQVYAMAHAPNAEERLAQFLSQTEQEKEQIRQKLAEGPQRDYALAFADELAGLVKVAQSQLPAADRELIGAGSSRLLSAYHKAPKWLPKFLHGKNEKDYLANKAPLWESALHAFILTTVRTVAIGASLVGFVQLDGFIAKPDVPSVIADGIVLGLVGVSIAIVWVIQVFFFVLSKGLLEAEVLDRHVSFLRERLYRRIGHLPTEKFEEQFQAAKKQMQRDIENLNQGFNLIGVFIVPIIIFIPAYFVAGVWPAFWVMNIASGIILGIVHTRNHLYRNRRAVNFGHLERVLSVFDWLPANTKSLLDLRPVPDPKFVVSESDNRADQTAPPAEGAFREVAFNELLNNVDMRPRMPASGTGRATPVFTAGVALVEGLPAILESHVERMISLTHAQRVDLVNDYAKAISGHSSLLGDQTEPLLRILQQTRPNAGEPFAIRFLRHFRNADLQNEIGTLVAETPALTRDTSEQVLRDQKFDRSITRLLDSLKSKATENEREQVVQELRAMIKDQLEKASPFISGNSAPGADLQSILASQFERMLTLAPASRDVILASYENTIRRQSQRWGNQAEPAIHLIREIRQHINPLTSFPDEELFAVRYLQVMKGDELLGEIARVMNDVPALTEGISHEELMDPAYPETGRVDENKPARIDRAIQRLLTGLRFGVRADERDQVIQELRSIFYGELLKRSDTPERNVRLGLTESRDGQQSNVATGLSGLEQRAVIETAMDVGRLHDMETWGGNVPMAFLMRELHGAAHNDPGHRIEDPFYNLRENTRLLRERLERTLAPYRAQISDQDWRLIFSRYETYKTAFDRVILPEDQVRRLLSGIPADVRDEAIRIYSLRQEALERGRNIFGLSPYPDQALDLIMQTSYKNGVDIFRIFDAKNDTRNIIAAINAVRKMEKQGARIQACIHYTTDFPRGIAGYVELAKELIAASGDALDALTIKDAGGVLEPDQAYALVKALRDGGVTVPIHVHTHDVRGNRQLTLLEAIRANGSKYEIRVDVAAGKHLLSAPFGQPSLVDFDRLVEGTRWGEQIHFNRQKLQEHEERIAHVIANHRVPLLSSAQRRRVVYSRLPGGMLTNFLRQIRELLSADHALIADIERKLGNNIRLFDEKGDWTPAGHEYFLNNYLEIFFEEMRVVTADTGNVSMVTPVSQYTGTQAFENVLYWIRKGWVDIKRDGITKNAKFPTSRIEQYSTLKPDIQSDLLRWAQDPVMQYLYPTVNRALVVKAFELQNSQDISLSDLVAALYPQAPAEKVELVAELAGARKYSELYQLIEAWPHDGAVDIAAVKEVLSAFEPVRRAVGADVADYTVIKLLTVLKAEARRPRGAEDVKAAVATGQFPRELLREKATFQGAVIALTDEELLNAAEQKAVGNPLDYFHTPEDQSIATLFPRQSGDFFPARQQWREDLENRLQDSPSAARDAAIEDSAKVLLHMGVSPQRFRELGVDDETLINVGVDPKQLHEMGIELPAVEPHGPAASWSRNPFYKKYLAWWVEFVVPMGLGLLVSTHVASSLSSIAAFFVAFVVFVAPHVLPNASKSWPAIGAFGAMTGIAAIGSSFVPLPFLLALPLAHLLFNNGLLNLGAPGQFFSIGVPLAREWDHMGDPGDDHASVKVNTVQQWPAESDLARYADLMPVDRLSYSVIRNHLVLFDRADWPMDEASLRRNQNAAVNYAQVLNLFQLRIPLPDISRMTPEQRRAIEELYAPFLNDGMLRTALAGFSALPSVEVQRQEFPGFAAGVLWTLGATLKQLSLVMQNAKKGDIILGLNALVAKTAFDSVVAIRFLLMLQEGLSGQAATEEHRLALENLLESGYQAELYDSATQARQTDAPFVYVQEISDRTDANAQRTNEGLGRDQVRHIVNMLRNGHDVRFIAPNGVSDGTLRMIHAQITEAWPGGREADVTSLLNRDRFIKVAPGKTGKLNIAEVYESVQTSFGKAAEGLRMTIAALDLTHWDWESMPPALQSVVQFVLYLVPLNKTVILDNIQGLIGLAATLRSA